MQFIGFRDTCVIERETRDAEGNPVRDEYDNPERSLVYDGECLYEEGGSGYSRSIITRNPTVYLPNNDVIVMINDKVTVQTEAGRTIESIVSIVRDVNLPWRANIKVTRIELKQAQGE